MYQNARHIKKHKMYQNTDQRELTHAVFN